MVIHWDRKENPSVTTANFVIVGQAASHAVKTVIRLTQTVNQLTRVFNRVDALQKTFHVGQIATLWDLKVDPSPKMVNHVNVHQKVFNVARMAIY